MERRRMFREPLWSPSDSPEAERVYAGWERIQSEAEKAGGDWALASRARRFPFDLAEKVVLHFEALRKHRWKLVTHPGKLAWSALTDPTFTFAKFVNEAPAPTPTSSAAPPSTTKPAPTLDEIRRRGLEELEQFKKGPLR